VIPTPPASRDRGVNNPFTDRSRWHVRAGSGVVFWLLALLAVGVAHRWVPASGWLLVHLVLLGAVTNAILVWSAHFTDALLRRQADSHRGQVCRLVTLNAGVAIVVAGMVASVWPLTLAGAVVVAAAVAAHAIVLVLQLRQALPSRFGGTVHYYVAGALMLPFGAALGAALAHGLPGSWHERLVLAHAALNLLGFVGLTVTGTLVTLWATMLRTRIVDGAERTARLALVVLVAGIVVAVAGCVADLRLLALLGVLVYLGGLGMAAVPLVAEARQRPPRTFATLSVLLAALWLTGSLVTLAVLVGRGPTWRAVGEGIDVVTAPLVAGFAAQVVIGALTYLSPVVLGGRPGVVRRTGVVIERFGTFRLVVVNGALLIACLPTPSVVRVLMSVLVLAGLGSFLVLLWLARRSARRGDTQEPGPVKAEREAEAARIAAGGRRVSSPHTGMLVAGLAVLALAVAGSVAVSPLAVSAGDGASTAAGVAPTGRTTTVHVTAKGMRFHPASVQVPAGNRLVIRLTNTDQSQVHDLALETGQHTRRLAPGGSAVLDAGVVGRSLDGWCTVIGHRQMGMVFRVDVVGGQSARQAQATAPASSDQGGMAGHDMSGSSAPSDASGPSAAADLDFTRKPGKDFRARDAALPPVPDGRVHRVSLTVRDRDMEVAPSVWQTLWPYDGRAPGPVLHGRVGDRFVVTLHNEGTMGHSIDFHAGTLAPDRPMRTIAPGQSLTYRFTATRSGIWLYHCSTMPMSAHIASGMFGAVIIDPPGLPQVDRSYVLVQSEYYLGPQHGTVDLTRLATGNPDLVTWNGYADQYDFRPLRARVGERVRIWVLAAGPDRGTAFHVVGGQFDTVFKEGAYLLQPGNATRGGSQVLDLGPAQGGFVELTFPQPGHYPFVSHAMIDAERGAHGIFAVTR
jgi:nitrite reductase (NO-forming)